MGAGAVAISHDDSACKNPPLPDVRSRRLVFYRGENQKIPRSSAGSLRLPVDCIAFQPFRPCITNVVRLEKQRDFGGV